MTKTTKKEFLWLLAGAALVFAYWLGSEIYYGRSISPQGIATANDYFKRFGEPCLVRTVKHDGKDYYEFMGQPTPSFLFAFPSSSPTYIFDEQGRFVTWCADPGDTHGYRQQWQLTDTNRIEPKVVREKLGLP